ncbi:MAG: lysophospholipid acyltransferase family protein, partial [Lysobacteraceae bacterium]
MSTVDARHDFRERRGASPLTAVPWAIFNLLQLAFTLLHTAFWIAIALVVRVVSGGPRLPLRMAARIWAPGLLGGAGARLATEGADAIDWSKPYVLVANHQSVIDICALFRAVPVPLRFVLKAEMGRVPFLGRYARAWGLLFVDRRDRAAGAHLVDGGAALLRGGATLCVFPEGTRSRDGRIAAFKGGAFQTAIEAGVDVLPVAIVGAGDVLPAEGLFRVRPGRITVRFGAPLPAAGRDRASLARDAREVVIALY